MASEHDETFGSFSDLTLDTTFLETIPFTLDDTFPHTFNDSSEASTIPQQTEIAYGDLFPSIFNYSLETSIQSIPEMIPQQTEISSLPEEDDNINLGVVPSAVHGVEVKQLDEVNKVHEKEKSRRKYEVWTVEEHGLFLEGLKKYDKAGERSKIWKKISTEFVVSKTPRQVASHAQKFYQRQKNEEGKPRRRMSINDITQSS